VTDSESLRLLRLALIKSDLSSTQFAETVLLRDPRTLRRWLKGDSPIPRPVRDYLLQYVGTLPNVGPQ
jgi:hypothetical protein